MERPTVKNWDPNMASKKELGPTITHSKELKHTNDPQEQIGTCKWPPREHFGLANGSQEKIVTHKWWIRKIGTKIAMKTGWRKTSKACNDMEIRKFSRLPVFNRTCKSNFTET